VHAKYVEGNKNVVSPRDEKSEVREWRGNVALWLLHRVKTNISLRDAVKLRSMQRPALTMQQPDSGRGAGVTHQ